MTETFASVRLVGGLLPGDLLSQVVSGRELDGLAPVDYHLAAGESVREAANRSWAYLRGAWTSFRSALEALPEADRATTLTRERWLMLLFRELGYGRVPPTPAGGVVADGKSFPVSHAWQHVPVHLLGWRVDLDRKSPGVAGAAEASPQSLVQELLNRSDESLWAVLSNGRVLRLLRDSTSLVGPAYIEFDLEAMFDGELFADFVALFSLAHQSRLELLDDAQSPAECWLERWRVTAEESGTRALNLLRGRVVEAIETLGTGFLRHAANGRLREDLAAGRLSVEDFRQALLRGVYRLLFLFVAEDRGALLDPAAPPEARRRYETYFATARLRRVAQRRRGSRHADLWRSLSVVVDGLGSESGRPELGIAGLGGLFEPFGTADAEGRPADLLSSLEVSNEALLTAVRALSTVPERGSGRLRVVDYRNLGAEELGSIYESLLEYVPRHDPGTGTFQLQQLSGNERKTTGSYYTPTSLIEVLLDSALDPVLDDAQQADDPREGLLRVTVCDPACGSGHFLVAAARRIAKRVAALDTGDPEPSPDAVRAALREVVTRCIYGVDLNPLAAELAKVSLWLETLQPGKPLAFLDAHIKIGNALLGTTPRLLAEGVPDAAFKPIEGDDKKFAAALAKRNKNERQRAGQAELFGDELLHVGNRRFGEAVTALGRAGDSLADVHHAARRYRQLQSSPELRHAREVADAWCAAFVWRKTADAPPPVTQRVLTALDATPDGVDPGTRAEVDRLARQYRFFHWHLEFPDVFPVPESGVGADPGTGWAGGFTCVLGNPPWEHTELKEQEFFAARDPDIAAAAGAARKRLIADLADSNPHLARLYQDAKREADAISHFSRTSGRYPFCGRGRINTYALFAETDRTILGPTGRLGVILPTGIATDATTQYFFRDVVETGSLATLYDFENRRPLFEGVHSRFKFVLLSLTGRDLREAAADFAFFVHDPADLAKPDVRFALKPDEITLLNPNTGTCPVFRSRRDAEITLGIYRRVPILLREGDPDGNPWGLSFMQGLFNMTSDSHLFRTREQLEADGWTLHGNVFERGGERFLPLYEAKMLASYDHRSADVVKSATAQKRQNQPRYLTEMEHKDPHRTALPLSWIAEQDLHSNLPGWLTGFSDVTSATNERTVLSAALPRAGVGHTYPLYSSLRARHLLLSMFNSFCIDYVARQKVAGLHLTYNYVQQFPVLHPSTFRTTVTWMACVPEDWVSPRVTELAYTAWDMQQFATDLGDEGPPFVWDDERRAVLRAELDAAYFHLYGLDRDEVDYVLDTFPIVKRKDEARFGEFRTKRLILEIYDAMAKAAATGEPYRTVLDPPPGHGRRHPERDA